MNIDLEIVHAVLNFYLNPAIKSQDDNSGSSWMAACHA